MFCIKKDQKNYFVFRTKKPNLHLDHRLLKLHLLWREFRHIGFHLRIKLRKAFVGLGFAL